MVIGITGSIGTGKSTVSSLIQDKGYTVVDADQLSHKALEKDTHTFYQVTELFDCLDDNGQINRKKLGAIVFNDDYARKQLESIIHPYVIDCIQKMIPEYDILFLDVPLLYESHMDTLCDSVLVVSCNEDLQLKRVMLRDHCSQQEAMSRIHAQMSLKEKEHNADYVIYNNDDLSSLKKEVERFLNNEVIHF